MEKSIIITKIMVAKTILFGACSERIPTVGQSVNRLSQSDLIWAERMLPIKGLKLDVPLWTLSGYGSGDGSVSKYEKLVDLCN